MLEKKLKQLKKNKGLLETIEEGSDSDFGNINLNFLFIFKEDLEKLAELKANAAG